MFITGIVVDNIIAKVKQVQYFSVICDELTDVSHQEQLRLCVRFLDETDGQHRIREEFLQFQAVINLTGEGLSAAIINSLLAYGLDLSMMVGQGYDGASSMSGCVNGVQTKVRETASLATCVHCFSRVLSLVLNTACSVPENTEYVCHSQRCNEFY